MSTKKEQIKAIVYPNSEFRMSAVSQIDAYDAACNEIIAQCGGDARGAVRALLYANEFLEADLAKALRAASSGYGRQGTVKRDQDGAVG